MRRENNEDSNLVRWLLVYFSFAFLFHPSPAYTCHDPQSKSQDPHKKGRFYYYASKHSLCSGRNARLYTHLIKSHESFIGMHLQLDLFYSISLAHLLLRILPKGNFWGKSSHFLVTVWPRANSAKNAIYGTSTLRPSVPDVNVSSRAQFSSWDISVCNFFNPLVVVRISAETVYVKLDLFHVHKYTVSTWKFCDTCLCNCSHPRKILILPMM